jgi:hypothetical protein
LHASRRSILADADEKEQLMQPSIPPGDNDPPTTSPQDPDVSVPSDNPIAVPTDPPVYVPTDVPFDLPGDPPPNPDTPLRPEPLPDDGR